MLLALLSLVAIIVMAFVAPRLAHFPLGALVRPGIALASAPAPSVWPCSLVRAVAGVRHRRGRQQARPTSSTWKASVSSRSPIGPCSSGCTPPMPSAGSPGPSSAGSSQQRHELPRRSAVRRGRALPGRVLERAARRRRGGDRGRLPVLAHGVPAPPRPWLPALVVLSAFSSRARWTRGRGCTPTRPAQRDRMAGGDGVRRLSAPSSSERMFAGRVLFRSSAAAHDHGLGRRRRARRAIAALANEPTQVAPGSSSWASRSRGRARRVRTGRGGSRPTIRQRDRRRHDGGLLRLRLEPAHLRVARPGVRPTGRDGASS